MRSARVAGWLALGAVAFAADARPARDVDRTYYSDETFTTEVGWMYLPCNGRPQKYGKVTRFSSVSSETCDQGGIAETPKCNVCGKLDGAGAGVNCTTVTCPPAFSQRSHR